MDIDARTQLCRAESHHSTRGCPRQKLASNAGVPTLEGASESPGGLIKTLILTPGFQLQLVWGGLEFACLTYSQVLLMLLSLGDPSVGKPR